MASHGVAIENFACSPKEMEIEHGDNVIWINKDNISTPPLATMASSTAATIVKVTASK